MKTWIYTVLIIRLRRYNDNEYAVTPSSGDIDCFLDHELAYKHFNELKNTHCSQGYHIADSDAPENDPYYSLMVRLEDEKGHVVVLELAWKIADEPNFNLQDNSTQAPSKSESKQT